MASTPHRVSLTQSASHMQLRDHGDISFDSATHRRVTVSTPLKAPETAVASQFARHDQNLFDVMVELERCQTDHRAAFVFDLTQSGRVHPLDEKDLRRYRKEKDGVFGPKIRDTPTLTAGLPFTFTSLPSMATVERVLKKDIGGENHFRFAPSRGSLEEDADPIIHLLDNIGKARYSEPGSIIHMQSPTFNRAKRWIAGWEANGMLGQSEFRMTVASTGEIFELEYYEHHFSTTLLTGSKVWLAFPPLECNLDPFHKAYEDIDIIATLKVPVGALGKMQHGIAIIQKPGQTLVVPPYLSLMTFCTSNSTSCGFYLATASRYMSRIKYMDLWLTVNLLSETPLQQQSHLIDYATQIASHFSAIMTGNLTRFKVNAIPNDICQEWVKVAPQNEKGYQNMKEKISSLLSSIEDVEARERIEEMFRDAWIDFLDGKRKKKPECRLCHVRIAAMPGEGSRGEKLARHTAHFEQGAASRFHRMHDDQLAKTCIARNLSQIFLPRTFPTKAPIKSPSRSSLRLRCRPQRLNPRIHNAQILLHAATTHTHTTNQPAVQVNRDTTTKHHEPAIRIINPVKWRARLYGCIQIRATQAIEKDSRPGLLLANVDGADESVVHTVESDE